MIASFLRRNSKTVGCIARKNSSMAAPAARFSGANLAGSKNLKAEVFYKNQIPFIHLPIPPNLQTQNFVVYPQMTFKNLIDNILIQQQGVPVELTNAENGK